MLEGKKIAVVMPGYFAEKTIKKTVDAISREVVDFIILVDDCSRDRTVEVAKGLGIDVRVNEKNQNYGGNVKRCLQYGLDAGADIVVQLHPDFQYTPRLIPAMAAMLTAGHYDLCLASRTSGRGAMSGGMPMWRYLANWSLTNVMCLMLGTYHTEFHTGYRAYTRELLTTVPFHSFRNDFIFDNEMLVAALRYGFPTSEVTCPTSYEADASSIPFKKAVIYGLQCLRLSAMHLGWRIITRLRGQRILRRDAIPVAESPPVA